MMAKIPEWLLPAVRERGEDLVIEVTVIPRAGRNAVEGLRNNTVLVRVTSAPEQGKANEAVLSLIAELLDMPVSMLAIIRGATSRHKQVLARKRIS